MLCFLSPADGDDENADRSDYGGGSTLTREVPYVASFNFSTLAIGKINVEKYQNVT